MILSDKVTEDLFRFQDEKYRDFQAGLIPGKSTDNMIGVRTPELRKYAKTLLKEYSLEEISAEFLNKTPHRYFDEDQLHAFIISEIKDYTICMEKVEQFLPYVDNWATCDQMSPKIFKKHKEELLVKINDWIHSDATYTIRFAVGMLMQHFLDDDFRMQYPELVASLRSDEYYVNMMIAWYFATALAKQYEMVLPFIEEKRLDEWTHNKAIQKAIESYRITPEQKDYLRKLKVKNNKLKK